MTKIGSGHLSSILLSVISYHEIQLTRNGMSGEWRKLRKEELHDLYSSSSIIRRMKSRRMRRPRHVARMGEKRSPLRLLVGKPEGRRPLGRPSRRWVDNIRMDLVEVGWVMWTGLVWFRIGTGGEVL
jgi:hypothetical protein